MSRFLFTYLGNVQGVGFRYEVYNISRKFDITGYVQNLESGEVELLIEGERTEVLKMGKKIETKLKDFWSSIRKEEKYGEPHYNTFMINNSNEG